MKFEEVRQLYWDIFNSLIDEISFEEIAESYRKKYDEFVLWMMNENLKIKGVQFGRESKPYGLNVIYGWFLETIWLQVFKKNKNIKSISLFGDDSEHTMSLKENKIEIVGKRTTSPDFEIELKNDLVILMELKSAVKEKFTIKKGNVNTLMDSSIRYEKPTVLIMLDLKNKKYGLKDFNYFINVKAKPNRSMEGQLCYDFPFPTNEIKKITSESFDDYTKNEEYKNSEEYKKRKIKIKSEKIKSGDPKFPIKKLIKKKFKLDDLEVRKKFLEEEISELRKGNKNIGLSWDAIDDQMDKN